MTQMFTNSPQEEQVKNRKRHKNVNMLVWLLNVDLVTLCHDLMTDVWADLVSRTWQAVTWTGCDIISSF